MREEELEQRIRDAMMSDQPALRAELGREMLSRRLKGERVALPLDPPATHRRWIIPAAAAAVLLLAVPLFRQKSFTPAPTTSGVPVDGSFFSPALLLAQTSSPAFLPLTTLNARDLREGSWTHGDMKDGKASSTYTYSLKHSRYQGNQAWLVVSTFKEGESGWSKIDSTWSNPDSMTPIFRVSHTDSLRVERTWRPEDILVGTTTANGFTAWTTEPIEDPMGLHGGPLYTVLRMPEVAIRMQASTLNDKWTGSMPFRGMGMDRKIHTWWMNFAVDGTEEIEVPGGKFDCWRIVLFLGARPIAPSDTAYHRPIVTYWVSREQQWLVRIGIRDAPPYVQAIELMSGREE